MKTIGYIAVTVILMVYHALLSGWALSKLWAWFIVKTFDLPPLSIPAAIGFALTVDYLTQKLKASENKKPYGETLLEGAVASTIKPLFALAIGAVVRLWL